MSHGACRLAVGRGAIPSGLRSLIGTLAPLFLQMCSKNDVEDSFEPRTLLRAFLQPVLVVGVRLGRSHRCHRPSV